MTYDYARELKAGRQAVSTAIEIADKRFRSVVELNSKDVSGDLVTDVDLECEAAIVAILRESFPDHSLFVEESENYISNRDAKKCWIVDPLDGTNNYAYALPVYGVTVAYCEGSLPVVACVAEGMGGPLITAANGSGVTVGGHAWSVDERRLRKAARPSAAFWMGYEVDRREAVVVDIIQKLANRTRRTFENWAPTADLALYLRGGIDVIVGHKCRGTELPAVLLVLQEAGARIVPFDWGGFDWTGSLDSGLESFIAGEPDLVAEIVNDLGSLRRR